MLHGHRERTSESDEVRVEWEVAGCASMLATVTMRETLAAFKVRILILQEIAVFFVKLGKLFFAAFQFPRKRGGSLAIYQISKPDKRQNMNEK